MRGVCACNSPASSSSRCPDIQRLSSRSQSSAELWRQGWALSRRPQCYGWQRRSRAPYAGTQPVRDKKRTTEADHAQADSRVGEALEQAEGAAADSAKSAGRATEEAAEESSMISAKIAAPVGLGLGLVALLAGGYLFKGQLRHFIDTFIHIAEAWGPYGFLAYGGVYTVLEVLAVPAVPLTMTAGIIFGPVPGTIIVSIASTAAATLAFLIARYAARDKILELAAGNPKFKAVDRAIGRNGFKVVTLLRLSPLLPLSLSNYFYGLTSLDLPSYVVASWLGMLPGTILYVCAGNLGRDFISSGEGSLPVSKWQLVLGIAVSLGALGYMGKLAKTALDEAEEELASEAK